LIAGSARSSSSTTWSTSRSSRKLETSLALLIVAIGWARPAPWLLALLLVVVLSAVWAAGARGFLLVGAWSSERTAD
jgi:hypothetical protein